MDVAVSHLRAELADWVGRARDGEEIVVTDRGTPVARLLGISAAPLLEQLTREGVIAAPETAQRPTAVTTRRAYASGPVSDLIADQRR